MGGMRRWGDDAAMFTEALLIKGKNGIFSRIAMSCDNRSKTGDFTALPATAERNFVITQTEREN